MSKTSQGFTKKTVSKRGSKINTERDDFDEDDFA